MKKEIKFRAWDDGCMIYSHNNDLVHEHDQLSWFFDRIREDAVIMQFTGLKDKNGNNSSCLYEGDILSLYGKIIGNKYENEDLLKDTTNFLITEMGCEAWRSTEQEAIKRGCKYAV